MDRIKGGGLHLLLEIKSNKVELLNSLTLYTILYVPNRHNRLFRPLICLAGKGVLVLIALVVSHPTRELLVGLNGAFHRGQKFGVGGDEGCIGSHQLFQNSLLHGSCRSKDVEIFVEVSNRPVQTICLGCLLWFRRLPKCAVSGAKLVLTSHGLLLDLGLPVCWFVQIFPVRPKKSFLGRSSQLLSTRG